MIIKIVNKKQIMLKIQLYHIDIYKKKNGILINSYSQIFIERIQTSKLQFHIH
jgi:hypothetical protein